MPRSGSLDPLGWPSRGLSALGDLGADSELPLWREGGRLLCALGELLDAPALLLEGVFTLDLARLSGSGRRLLTGTGGALTASLNLPFFLVTGPNVDIGAQADDVNAALAHMEALGPDGWARARTCADDARTEAYPRGTRVRASGRNLIWTLPGEGEVLQACEESPAFRLALFVSGTHYGAQERSWGFVVPDREREGAEVETILHEFYHQHEQIRSRFQAWSLGYWLAYGAAELAGGYAENWAEYGPRGAYLIDRALAGWSP